MNQSNFDRQLKNNALNRMMVARMDDVFEHFGINLYQTDKYYYGSCPVHSSKRSNTLNILNHSNEKPGCWVCYSNNCQKHFKKSFLGFVQGVLSHRELGWLPDDDHNHLKYDWIKSRDYMCDFLGVDWEDIQPDPLLDNFNQHLTEINDYTGAKASREGGLCPRQKYREFVLIPAKYYLGRGYSEEILDRYDVGFCDHPKSELNGRITVPVYDELYRAVQGITARSPWEKCAGCKQHHDPLRECPQFKGKAFVKWVVNENFNSKHFLYNHWFAREAVAKDLNRAVLIVEGPGDVWRLAEAGFSNSVGLFGANISTVQANALERLGTHWIIVCTDSDDAGEAAYRSVAGNCKYLGVPIDRVSLPKKDIGEMTINEIREIFGPLLKKKRKK